MERDKIREVVEKSIEKSDGILRLEPAWVARTFLPPGRRLGLKENAYELGPRGGICERWLASTTNADNEIKIPDEGLSYLSLDSKERITLKSAVQAAPQAIMGKVYASKYSGLSRLAKLFDYEYRIPYHIHQMRKHASLVGRNPKEEAYYFPEGLDMGKEPDTYFGVHPYIAEEKKYDILLPYMVDWDSDLILRHSRGYHLVPDDGYHVPSGILHAPGSALTIELQEDSDVFAMMQAKVGSGKIISKDLLFKDVRPEDKKKKGERIILEMIDWGKNGDHYFYENRHIPPVLTNGTKQNGGEEYWIIYNTLKFSAKKLVVQPMKKYNSIDKGVYSLFIWKGKGKVNGNEVEAGNPKLDELLICHDRATTPMVVENSGSEYLIMFKFFGPDINKDIPKLKEYKL
jgi:hypothetical protein